MSTLVQLLASLCGVGLWAFLVVRHGGVYRGSQAFYLLSQREAGPGHRLAVAVLGGPLGRMSRDYAHFRESVENDRISPVALKQYSDESLEGYGDEQFDKGGEHLSDQQRGLILPLLERALSELEPGRGVVEVGTGNGDVIAHLAERYPKLRFFGVDLSVATAIRKHGEASNLEFVPGYALDLLDDGSLSGDLVFSSSTWVVFTPLELRAYVRALSDAGFSQIVLNEPTWGKHTQTDDSNTSSWHLEGAVWHHNYAGYLREAGYSVCDFEFRPYSHPVSPRSDIHVLLVRGRTGSPAEAGTGS